MILLKSNQKYVREYIRVMNCVDVKECAVKRIINNCSRYVSDNRIDVKVPAIAAISCAAVAAVAVVGIPKIKRNIDRKG